MFADILETGCVQIRFGQIEIKHLFYGADVLDAVFADWNIAIKSVEFVLLVLSSGVATTIEALLVVPASNLGLLAWDF
ncbi:MAG: hypothetical protein JST89_01295 [Cyanobacteria bacterium SZAS-4]|nr:hypothetical protein [Cyanobacteria bacterium SZAS-4]